MSKSINVKITINAQVGDGNAHEIGTADLPIAADANGKVTLNLEQAIRDALCDHTHVANTSGKPEPILAPEQWDKLKAGRCGNHKPVQHRDGKPPWCNTCKG